MSHLFESIASSQCLQCLLFIFDWVSHMPFAVAVHSINWIRFHLIAKSCHFPNNLLFLLLLEMLNCVQMPITLKLHQLRQPISSDQMICLIEKKKYFSISPELIKQFFQLVFFFFFSSSSLFMGFQALVQMGIIDPSHLIHTTNNEWNQPF